MFKSVEERMANKLQKQGSIAGTVEEPEGLEGFEDDALGEYPIDTLLIRTENRTVFDVVRRIRSGGFVMNPDFQRDFVWDVEKQSKLIESVVMRIPLPVFYLAEDKKGKTIVVDGLQRLSTFRAFLDDQFSLKLPHQESLNKKRFKSLSPKLQNRIEDCNLVLYIIDSKVPERAKLDIFERVNSGEILTRQQMRNCLYTGPATRWLKDEATTELFITATGGSLDAKKMRDREFVNRFCAFTLVGVNEYRKDMDDFLAKSLEIMNQLPESRLADLSRRFRAGIENNYTLFERHAFRKHCAGQRDRSVINASLWDVMTTGLSTIPAEVVSEKADRFRSEFYSLLKNPVFDDAITYSPNSTKKVRARFEMAGNVFKEVFGDYAN
jgi:hypothetical protein